MKETKYIHFWLDGCDIAFTAKAPEDITLKQLLKQTDKIKPHWCACGIKSIDSSELNTLLDTEIIIDYDSIRKRDDEVSCDILEE